jgi:hypothetical protein
MLPFGPFEVSRDGSLRLRDPQLRPVLRYRWRGLSCLAEVTPQQLRLIALVGRIPSTAERGADRGFAVRALVRLRAEVPAPLELRVLPDHRVVLRRQASPPAGMLDLITEMTRFALALDPFVEPLAESMSLPQPMVA